MLAIIVTIIVLELKVPHGTELENLAELLPVFLSYVLSFTYVGIYWSNHHHLMHTVKHVSGSILWANLHLLFWLSLVPFTTGWMGENHFAHWPVILYLCNMLLCAVAYTILVFRIEATHGGKQSELAQAIGTDRKSLISLVLYVAGMLACFWTPWAGVALAAVVAAIWLVPDPRIEAALKKQR